MYPLVGCDERKRWYLIHGGIVRGCVAEPTDEAMADVAAARIAEVFADPFTAAENLERCVDSVLIVVGWFRHREREKRLVLTRKGADARCRIEAARSG